MHQKPNPEWRNILFRNLIIFTKFDIVINQMGYINYLNVVAIWI